MAARQVGPRSAVPGTGEVKPVVSLSRKAARSFIKEAPKHNIQVGPCLFPWQVFLNLFQCSKKSPEIIKRDEVLGTF